MCYDLKTIPVYKSSFKKKEWKGLTKPYITSIHYVFLVYLLKEIDERRIHKF